MSSTSSNSSTAAHSYQDSFLPPTADDANLAAAVAAVAVAADAAMDASAFDELPYLPDTAVADTGLTASDQTQAEPGGAVAAVQAGLDTFTTAVRGLFGTSQESTDPGLLEVAVVADGSASPQGNEARHVQAQGKPPGMSGLRQKSKGEKRPRLLLLANGMLMPLPVVQLQQPAPDLQDAKHLIAGGLKRVSASAAPAKHMRKASEASVKFEAAPAAAAPVEQPLRSSQVSVNLAAQTAANAPSVASLGSLRRASVTSKGSASQVSVPALRSKSFSAGSKAPVSSVEGKISPSAASASRESPFHKAARSQISQHVERSSASATVHSSAGSVATQLLDQLKGLRPGHGSQHDMHHPPRLAPHPHAIHTAAPSEAGSAYDQHVSACSTAAIPTLISSVQTWRPPAYVYAKRHSVCHNQHKWFVTA